MIFLFYPNTCIFIKILMNAFRQLVYLIDTSDIRLYSFRLSLIRIVSDLKSCQRAISIDSNAIRGCLSLSLSNSLFLVRILIRHFGPMIRLDGWRDLSTCLVHREEMRNKYHLSISLNWCVWQTDDIGRVKRFRKQLGTRVARDCNCR